MLIWETIFCSLVSILAIIFFKGEPPSPPSASTDIKNMGIKANKNGQIFALDFVTKDGKKKVKKRGRKKRGKKRRSKSRQRLSKGKEGISPAEASFPLWENQWKGYHHQGPDEMDTELGVREGQLEDHESATDQIESQEEEEYEEAGKQLRVVWWNKSYRRNLWELCKDPNFMVLTLAFGIAVGSFYAVATLWDQILPQSNVSPPFLFLSNIPVSWLFVSTLTHNTTPYHTKRENAHYISFSLQREMGVLGMLMIVMGVAGAFFAGIALDMTRQFNALTKVSFVGLFLGYLWFFFEAEAKRNFIMMSVPVSFLVRNIPFCHFSPFVLIQHKTNH